MSLILAASEGPWSHCSRKPCSKSQLSPETTEESEESVFLLTVKSKEDACAVIETMADMRLGGTAKASVTIPTPIPTPTTITTTTTTEKKLQPRQGVMKENSSDAEAWLSTIEGL